MLHSFIHYHPELVLHTASSGAVDHLAELYLVLESAGQVLGLGEVRENICYLNGLTPVQVRKAVVGLLEEISWESGPQEIIKFLSAAQNKHPAVAKALVDSTMHDWWARQNYLSVAENLGRPFTSSHSTNQCIFWCPDKQCLDMAQKYVFRNFLELKLRVGIAEFSQDLARIALLRDNLEPEVKISVDANGAWQFKEALENIDRLAALDVSYVEQPIAAGNWDQLERLAEKVPIPIMLDESIVTVDDVRRAIDCHDNLSVHLKIVKIGGITPLLEAAEILNRNNRTHMVGQMNEGSGATAAAFQCVLITQPKYAELYGADGLLDDVLEGITYGNGNIIINDKMGTGVQFKQIPEKCLWEKEI